MSYLGVLLSPSTRPHLQEATCAHQAPRPQAGSEAPRARLALGVPAPPMCRFPASLRTWMGEVPGTRLSVVLPWSFQPPLPAGHAPSGPGPGLSPGQSPSRPTHCLLEFFRGCSSPGDQPRCGGQAWGSTLCLSIPRQLAGPSRAQGLLCRCACPPAPDPSGRAAYLEHTTSPQPHAAGRGLPAPSTVRLRLRVTPQPSQHPRPPG